MPCVPNGYIKTILGNQVFKYGDWCMFITLYTAFLIKTNEMVTSNLSIVVKSRAWYAIEEVTGNFVEHYFRRVTDKIYLH